MEKIKVILGLAVFALVMSTGWQIAACELANVELKDDLKCGLAERIADRSRGAAYG